MVGEDAVPRAGSMANKKETKCLCCGEIFRLMYATAGVKSIAESVRAGRPARRPDSGLAVQMMLKVYF